MAEYEIKQRDLNNLDIRTTEYDNSTILIHQVTIGNVDYWSTDLVLLQNYFETIASAFKQKPE